MIKRDVLAFDGEGQRDRYVLLADSDGCEIHSRIGLRAADGLKFLTRPHLRNRLCFWFSFGYDVNMLLRGVEDVDFWQGRRAMWIGPYLVEYMPNKLLKIKVNGQRFTHYDIFGFFQTSFRSSIDQWLGVTDEVIEKGKAARGSFETWTMQAITQYNARELVYLRRLGERLIECFSTLDVPLKMKSWHGAGAAAQAALASIRLEDEITDDPRLNAYAQAAYYGGRIETLQRGSFSKVYHADLRSAYPSAMLDLPDLSSCAWREVRHYQPGSIGVYAIQFKASERSLLGPFPVRWSSGLVVFPLEGSGVYWSFEIQAALDAGVKVKVLRGLVAHGALPSGLAEFVPILYDLRKRYKQEKDGREKAVKLTLNALYGKMAQRTEGRYQSLALAGMITSHTRAKLYRAASQADDEIIALATDGIYARGGLDLEEGDQLGQWESEIVDHADMVMNGVYRIDRTGRSSECKTRGFNLAGDQFEEVYSQIMSRGEGEITMRRFVSHSLHLSQPQAFPVPCVWREVTRRVDPHNDLKRCWPGMFDGSPQMSAPLVGGYESVSYNPRRDEEIEPGWIDLDDV